MWLSQTDAGLPIEVLLGPLGLLAFLLVVVVWGGRKGWWYFSNVVELWKERCSDERKEKEFWRDAALKGIGSAEKGLRAAEVLAGEPIEVMAAKVDAARRAGLIP